MQFAMKDKFSDGFKKGQLSLAFLALISCINGSDISQTLHFKFKLEIFALIFNVFNFFFFFGHPTAYGVPELGLSSELQLQPYTTAAAMLDPLTQGARLGIESAS